MTINDIKWALNSFRAKRDQYEKAAAYFDGRHPRLIVNERYWKAFSRVFDRLNVNLCPTVVTTLKDRLKLSGFTSEGGSDDIAQKIIEIQRYNRFDMRTGLVHSEAIKFGDSYVLVWADPTGQPVFYLNDARNVTVEYDADVPNRLTRAARIWRPSGTRLVRLNLYFPDRIEKYVSMSNVYDAVDGGVMNLNERSFRLFTEDTDGAVLANPFGRVPVFHFANNASISGFGRSELEQAYAPQDRLNKTLLDLVVASEQAAKVPRWATGITVNQDPLTGKKINPFKNDEFFATDQDTVKFGEFTPQDITQFIAAKKDAAIDVAIVTGTPLHFFNAVTGEFPSGEALKTAEAPLSAKVYDRQVSFGNTWEDAATFALEVAGYEGVSLDSVWEDTAPRNEADVLNNAVSRVTNLGGSKRQAWRDQGYSDAEIDTIFEERAKEDAANPPVIVPATVAA